MVKRVFLCGIAGTGMSALAGLFRQRGFEVFGSDRRFYPPVDQLLKELDVTLFEGFDAAHIPADVDFCVIGNVISRGNPEAETILDRGLEYYSMAEALQRFFLHGKRSLVVAGSHGKTTTASFVAHLLDVAGLKPGFFIGGKPLNFAANHRLAAGEYFVSEGDEYETAFFDRSAKFFKYRPELLLITALEHDHVDFYPTAESYLRSFRDLVDQVPGRGRIIANGDYEMARQAVARAHTPVLFYGGAENDRRIVDLKPGRDGCGFTLESDEGRRRYHCPLPGAYNAWNVAAGIVLAQELGLEEAVVERALETFRGVERRLSAVGRLGKTVFLSDFAHHPTAIAQVLAALPHAYPGHRIVAVFDPRSWSLRRNFFQERLPQALSRADEIVINDIYEKEKIPPEQRLSLDALRSALEAMGRKVRIGADLESILGYLGTLDLEREQVVILLSNGDVRPFGDWLERLTSKGHLR
ncbi:MAG: UDP-N-acetylmuramate:L-alanyl-gamma-D-glutamyl-meso-diaminopimelate ligase [Candidatus Aminicenantes bacterium]|nr:UDP-N-acetylmuramate:L-alanyl-gamma-D-glutamyl-meso-diaminopimelate ligase [Candidatus Aminicenantes bacterium]